MGFFWMERGEKSRFFINLLKTYWFTVEMGRWDFSAKYPDSAGYLAAASIVFAGWICYDISKEEKGRFAGPQGRMEGFFGKADGSSFYIKFA